MPPELVGWLVGGLLVFIFLVPAAALVGLPRRWPMAIAGAITAVTAYWFLLPRYESCAPNDLYCRILLAFVEQTAFPPAPVCWAGLAIIVVIKVIAIVRR